jgi:hypothetical protein
MIPSLLTPFLPTLLALLASMLWWRNLSSPWLFFVSATLAAFGIQAVIAFVRDYWPQFSGGYFLEANVHVSGKLLSEADIQRALEREGRTALIQASCPFCAAVPFLFWLKSGLSTK